MPISFTPRIYPYDIIVRKRGGGERRIPGEKIRVQPWASCDRGEDAALYEVMPHDGRRMISPNTIIRKEKRRPE